MNVQHVGPRHGHADSARPGRRQVGALYGSTGDYTPLAFYPNGVEEAFRVSIQAFERGRGVATLVALKAWMLTRNASSTPFG